MPNAHINARSSRREELPIELRVYGLEGITETQDEAISQHSVTIARHDERLGGNDTAIAVLTTQVAALVASMTSTNNTMSKVLWALVGLSTSIALSCFGAVLAVLTGLIG